MVSPARTVLQLSSPEERRPRFLLGPTEVFARVTERLNRDTARRASGVGGQRPEAGRYVLLAIYYHGPAVRLGGVLVHPVVRYELGDTLGSPFAFPFELRVDGERWDAEAAAWERNADELIVSEVDTPWFAWAEWRPA